MQQLVTVFQIVDDAAWATFYSFSDIHRYFRSRAITLWSAWISYNHLKPEDRSRVRVPRDRWCLLHSEIDKENKQ